MRPVSLFVFSEEQAGTKFVEKAIPSKGMLSLLTMDEKS